MTAGSQEEGEYEYATDHQGSTPGREEAHLESAILVQPLISEAGGDATSQPAPRIAGNPIGVFVAVGCAAKATSEAF
jgi:hypothetical protein